MNSDDEKKLFESWGWEYNYIKRRWEAPDGYYLGNDDLVYLADTFGKDIEEGLRKVAIAHGNKSTQP